MPFGLEIFNSAGEPVFDDCGIMYERESGVMQWSNSWNLQNSAGMHIDYWHTRDHYNSWRAELDNPLLHCYQHIPPEVTAVEWWNSVTSPYPAQPMQLGDLAFVQIPANGIHTFVTFNSEIVEPGWVNGGNVLVGVPPFTPLMSYKIFSLARPANPSPGTYGMQLFDASGTNIYDSRYKTLGMEVYNISAAALQAATESLTAIDISLRRAAPNAWVSSPLFHAACSGEFSDQNMTSMKITQIDDTTLRLVPEQLGETAQDGNVYTHNRQYGPTTLFVLRDA